VVLPQLRKLNADQVFLDPQFSGIEEQRIYHTLPLHPCFVVCHSNYSEDCSQQILRISVVGLKEFLHPVCWRKLHIYEY
jgi:hypothetical protein